ncbi:MAG: hypothetical protein KA998_00655 [Rickettsiaceae bacterium]|nr:hypothetical protein [Rickettsiaceae bacterium]
MSDNNIPNHIDPQKLRQDNTPSAHLAHINTTVNTPDTDEEEYFSTSGYGAAMSELFGLICNCTYKQFPDFFDKCSEAVKQIGEALEDVEFHPAF